MEFFATVNGIPVHIYDSKGEGRAIIFLHGYLETLYIWEEFKALFESKYRVVLLDLPGHGLTGSAREVNSMELMASLVKGVMDLCSISKASLVGHSMGGYVAAQFLCDYPSSCESIIFMNSTPYSDTEQKREERGREISLVLNSKLNAIASLSVPKMFADINLRKYDQKIQETLELIDTHDPEGIVATIRGLAERNDNSDVIKASEIPVLFILGDLDNYITKPVIERIVEDFSNTKIVTIPNTGHCTFIEEMLLCRDALQAFLDTLN